MLHRAGSQHLAQKEGAQPSPALANHVDEADVHVGRIERLHATELLHVLGVFLDDGINDVVHSDDAKNVTALVDHWSGEEVIFGDEAGNLLTIRQWRYGHGPAWRRNGKYGDLRLAGDEPAE